MIIIDRIKKGVPEFFEQCKIVQEKMGGGQNKMAIIYDVVSASLRSQTY